MDPPAPLLKGWGGGGGGGGGPPKASQKRRRGGGGGGGGGGVPKILMERGDNPEKQALMQKWGVATFLLLYSSIAFTLCVCVWGGSKLSFITFWFFSLLS